MGAAAPEYEDGSEVTESDNQSIRYADSTADTAEGNDSEDEEEEELQSLQSPRIVRVDTFVLVNGRLRRRHRRGSDRGDTT